MLTLSQEGFITHPYLLSPTCDGMTIVWETAIPMQASVTVEGEGQCYQLNPTIEQGTPWQHFTQGTSFSRIRLNDLSPETEYYFCVILADGTRDNGCFKTLPRDPKKLRFLFLSDSHNFKIATQMNDHILAQKPDFVIHGGDFLVGSSLQKDQYQYWFKPMREVLRSIPVLYIKGNHDEGPYFDDYFTKGQRDIYLSDPLTGNNLSFRVGPIHLLLGNSNPWSLMEMNADTAGFELDEHGDSIIKSSHAWIDQQLSSPAVQGAPWRICVFHHHYLDALSRKYVVPLMEKNNIELTLMGHVHAYQHTLSANGNNHYVSIGDSINATSGLSYSHPSHLLMENVPELLALGQCDYAIITVNDAQLQLDLHTVLKLEAIGSQFWSKDAAPIDVSQIKFSTSNCIAGEVLTLEAKLTNNADFAQPAIINARLNGKSFPLNQFSYNGKKSVLPLSKGESQQLICEFVLANAGDHQLEISDQVFKIKVKSSPACFSINKALITKGEGTDSNLIVLDMVIENTGNLTGSYIAEMEIEGEKVCQQTVSLNGGAKQAIQLQYRILVGGIYQVSVNSQWIDEIEIQHGLTILPQVIDCSGFGHHAILHGQPVLTQEDGIISLCLDGKDDYVEIPAHADFCPDKAYATQIKAKINSLEGCNRFDHFALFSKGPSSVYGPNYLLRLAIRDSGCLTAGISFNIDEYFWDGGQIKLAHWSNYAASFDRAQGGNTWIDETCVANIAAIGEKAIIRNWPNYPIFIGLGYLGYVQKDIGRAKYYSLMKANLQRFRFYDRAIDSSDLDCKQLAVTSDKLQSDNHLKVDLDFSNIMAKGEFVSPWFDGFLVNRIAIEIDLPIKTKACLKFEVGNTIKRKELTDGSNVVETSISNKPLRVSLELQGWMEVDETHLPIVHTLKLHGNDQFVCWSTAADWYQGEFKGALGFENKHRLRNYPDDGSW